MEEVESSTDPPQPASPDSTKAAPGSKPKVKFVMISTLISS
jgi:hypothetical protein